MTSMSEMGVTVVGEDSPGRMLQSRNAYTERAWVSAGVEVQMKNPQQSDV